MSTKLLFLIYIVLTSSVIAMDPQKYNSSLYPDYSNIIAKKKGRGIKSIGIERCPINECLLENRNVDVVVDTEGNKESHLYIDKVTTENKSGEAKIGF